MDKKLSNIEIKMEQENPSIKEKYISFLSEDFQNISKVYEKISIYIKYNVGIDIFSIKHQKFNKTKSYLDLFITFHYIATIW